MRVSASLFLVNMVRWTYVFVTVAECPRTLAYPIVIHPIPDVMKSATDVVDDEPMSVSLWDVASSQPAVLSVMKPV